MDARLGDVDERSVRTVVRITRDVSKAVGEVTNKLWSQQIVGRKPRIFIEYPLALDNVGDLEVTESAAILSSLGLRYPTVDSIQTLISQSISAASITSILLGVCFVAICFLVRQKTLEDSDTEIFLV